MALPKLGLDAELRIDDFTRNSRVYLKLIDELDKANEKVAKSTKKKGDEADKTTKKLGALGQAARALGNTLGKVSSGLGGTVSSLGKAASSAGGLSKALGALGAGAGAAAATTALAFTGVVAAIGAVVAATGVLIKVTQASIASFQEQAQVLRLLQLQMGGVTSEISGFIRASQLAGAQMSQVASGIGIFEKKITDAGLRMAVGSEESHEFERALGALGISTKNADGSIRAIDDLLPEVADKFEYLGAGAFTTGLAMDLFGRAGRQMLPILLEGGDAMAESTKRAEELGAVMSKKDVEAAEELRRASVELELALKGVGNTIARIAIPALTDLVKWLTDTVSVARKNITVFGGLIVAMGQLGLLPFPALTREVADYVAAIGDLTGAMTEEEKAVEAAGVAENKRRQKVTEAIFERKEVRKKMVELEEQFAERMLAIEEDFAQREEDIQTARLRQLDDVAQRESDKRADLLLAFQRKVEDIMDAFNKKRDRRERDNQKKLDDFWLWANLQREKLLNRHLEKMRAIQEQFTTSANQAARRNDAVALLAAMERRDTDERLERERYANRRGELEKDIARRLKKLLDGFDEEERKEDERLADALAKAELWYARRLEDLAIALERERRDRALAWARQDEDLAIARARREAKVQEWYDTERAMLQTQLDGLNAIIGEGTTTMLQTYQNFVADYIATTDTFNAAMWQSYSSMPQMRPPGLGAGFTLGRTPSGAVTRNVVGMAEGGEGIVSRPTLFMAGEGGPERFSFAPVSSSVHHSSDPFRVDFSQASSPAMQQQMEQAFVKFMSRVVSQVR